MTQLDSELQANISSQQASQPDLTNDESARSGHPDVEASLSNLPQNGNAASLANPAGKPVATSGQGQVWLTILMTHHLCNRDPCHEKMTFAKEVQLLCFVQEIGVRHSMHIGASWLKMHGSADACAVA